MVTKNVVVHYKDRIITIVDINLDMYQVIDLFRDVRELAVEQEAELKIRRPLPRAAKEKPNASPSPSSVQPSSKQGDTVLEPVISPRRPSTRSQTSPSKQATVPKTPSSSVQPVEGLSQLILSPTRPLTRSKTSPSITAVVPTTPCSSQAIEGVSQLVGSPRRPLTSDVDKNVEVAVEEYLESDSEDSDFRLDEDEESDEVLLDEESNDNEGLDELDLELDTEQWITLGHEDANGSQSHVIIIMKDYCVQQGITLRKVRNDRRSRTCGRPRDDTGRLLERYKKKRKASTRPVGRPRKNQPTPGTSVGTSTVTVAALT
ncbi:hypothetical protein Cgig2_014319 [Carnegiea gigantea]|uniref:Uncharacterized protein n=1 Tax=Carnegiea gigantea TaxID=171969 RepID=A0A9Q1JGI1_9CARY|nr:hypothetical protein Cgig2_014319 [Carnegiea gigantea]